MSEVWVHKKQLLRWMCLIVLLLISNIAFMVDPQMMKLNQDIGNGLTGVITLLHSELRTVELSHVLSMIFLAFLYNRKLLRKKKDFCFTASIVGAVFSGFLLVGMSLEATADFDFIFGRKCQMIIALLVFLGFWSILYTGLKCIYEKLDVLQIKPHIYQGILRVIDCHFLIISIIVLLICWLIMALAFFPGSIPHDGRNELNMYFGITPLNLHHPYFSTMIMGTIYKLGYMACGITGGCILYVVFQSVLGALIFGMICNYVYRKSNLILFGVLSVMYFGVVPVWWSYMQAIMKDGLYVIMFAWFILEYIKTFFGDNGCYGLLRLILSAISVCILRNGAGFIVLPALLVLIFLLSDKRKWMITVFVIVCVANHGLNTVLMDELGLKSANQVEALSIPLQQMARYVTLYENEVTEEEKQIIDKIVAYEGIPDRYNPECSDPIKDRYRNTNEEEWKAFWGLWIEKFKQHPVTYITATMNHVYGYIDPFHFYYGLVPYQFYIKGALGEADEGIVYSKYAFLANTRRGMSEYAYTWNNIPGLSFVVNSGFYTWVGIVLIAGVLRQRKWRYAMLFVAPLMNVLICFASPVNGLVRYAMPVMAILPLLILVGLKPYFKLEKSE